MTFRNEKLYTLFFCWILFFMGFQGVAIADNIIDTVYFSDDEKETSADVLIDAKTAEIVDTSNAKTVRIHYRVDDTVIERNYMDNAHTLNLIDRIFADNTLDEDDFIVITGKASPEGPYHNNLRLAEQRALSLKNYIKQKYPEIKSSQIVTLSGGEDWEGLIDMVENDMNNPYRDDMRAILHSSFSRESQKIKLKKLDNGKAHQYLLKHILPHLREGATGTFFYKKEKPTKDTIKIVETVVIHRIDTVCPEKEIPEKTRKPFYLAVKNNLIYDAALLPNLSVEIPFGRNYNWSLAVDGNWSWWNTDADSYYYHRIQTAGVELRRWFGNKTDNPLNGWFAGAYGYGGTYDIRLFTDEATDEGQLSNWSYSGGLTIGYAKPIAKRFNLEFGLGFGYVGGKYYKYDVAGCTECAFPWRSTHQRNYFGPTKVNISLVWLIGSGTNKSKGKGDRR